MSDDDGYSSESSFEEEREVEEEAQEEEKEEENKKKEKVPPVTIEELMDKKRWNEVEKRLKRIKKLDRIVSLCRYCSEKPGTPDRTIRKLLDMYKKYREDRVEAMYVKPSIREHYQFDLSDAFLNCSLAIVKSMLIEFLAQVGPIRVDDSRQYVCFLWSRGRHGYAGRYGRDEYYQYSEQEEDILRGIQSKPQFSKNKDARQLYTMWEKTELLIKAAVEDWFPKSVAKLPFVHTMIQFHLPKFFVWLASRIYPSQMELQDQEGRIPLHWAAYLNNEETEDRSGYVKDFRVKFSDNLSKTLDQRMVELVVSFSPGGASWTDRRDLHPLTLLLDVEYRTWKVRGYDRNNGLNNDWTLRCAMSLIKHAPEVLASNNSLNGMLPFMAAACVHDDNSCMADTKGRERQVFLRKTNMAYEILRQNPTVVAIGRKATPREVYLSGKLEIAQERITHLEKEKRRLEDEIARLKKGDGEERALKRMKGAAALYKAANEYRITVTTRKGMRQTSGSHDVISP